MIYWFFGTGIRFTVYLRHKLKEYIFIQELIDLPALDGRDFQILVLLLSKKKCNPIRGSGIKGTRIPSVILRDEVIRSANFPARDNFQGQTELADP